MTEVELVNVALGNIGLEPIRAMNDPSRSARVMALNLPIARDSVLSFHPWRQAMKRGRLKPHRWAAYTDYVYGDLVFQDGDFYECTVDGTSGATEPTWDPDTPFSDGSTAWKMTYDNRSEFAYIYDYPADCLRILSIGEGKTWERMGNLVFCDAEPDPAVTYIRRMEVVDEWDSILCELIAFKLAVICYTQLGGQPNLYTTVMGNYEMVLRRAIAASASGGAKIDVEPGRWTDI
jgi:hypothetical protein